MYEKYTTALRLMDACIATKGLIEPEGKWPLGELRYVYKDGRTHAERHPCHIAWDECFTFIFENFARPPTVRLEDSWQEHAESVRKLLWVDRVEIERLVRAMPPELAEQVFPVAIARYLLREAALPFNHRLSKTFMQFHEWYSSMILAY